MAGSAKVYSAPHLETLSMRSTRDINVDVNVGDVLGAHVGLTSGLLS